MGQNSTLTFNTHFASPPQVFNGGMKMESHDGHTTDVKIQHAEVPGEHIVTPLGSQAVLKAMM